MISGTFTVEASDDPTLVVGESYPLNIDDTTVTLTTVTSTIVTAVGTADPTPLPSDVTPSPDTTTENTTSDTPAVADPGSVV